MCRRLARLVTRRMLSGCPAIQAPASTLLSKPMITAQRPGDLAEAVDHVGRALFVVLRVVQAVQRAPGARIDQVFEALPDGQPAALVDLGRRYADFLGAPSSRRRSRLRRPRAWRGSPACARCGFPSAPCRSPAFFRNTVSCFLTAVRRNTDRRPCHFAHRERRSSPISRLLAVGRGAAAPCPR